MAISIATRSPTIQIRTAGATTAWSADQIRDLGGMLGRGRVAKSAIYTIVSDDRGKTIDVTSGTFTIDVTSAATLGNGWLCAVMNSGAGVATIDPAGAETIRTPSGAASTLALAQGQSVVMQSDGTNLIVIASTGLSVGPGTPLSVHDSTFLILDNVDPTKIAQFELSAIATGTTRTFTLPDASTALVGTDVTQTLTNKTLTSPVISGGTINSASVGATTPSTGVFTTLGASGTSTLGAVNCAVLAATTLAVNNGNVANRVTVGNLTNGNSGATLLTGSGTRAWLIGAEVNLTNTLEFTPSTVNGGTTFTTPVLSVGLTTVTLGSAVNLAMSGASTATFGTGVVSMPGTTASTTPTTGALTVAGGAGISGALNVGGLVKGNQVWGSLGTITANAAALYADGTWNNAAMSFSAMQIDITDTASASNSQLINLRTNGVSRFVVTKNGSVSMDGVSTLTTGTGAIALNGTTTVNADIVFSGGNRAIRSSTSDASDTQFVSLAGGGAAASGRGAFVNAIGNEFATTSFRGCFEFVAGFDAGFADANAGSIRFSSSGGEKLRLWRSGGLELNSAGPSSDPGAGSLRLNGSLRLGNTAVAATPTATHTMTIVDAAGTTYRVLCVV